MTGAETPPAAAVAAAVEEAVAAIAATGAPVAVVAMRGGEVLASAASGADMTGQAFTVDRPVFLYSAIKPVAALAVLLAASRGALDLDDRVAATWPAFGAHGKDDVTVRQALAHAAAVPGWAPGTDVATVADREAAARALAASPPWWPIGEPGEHAVSYGTLLDGILRAATGEDILAWAERAREVIGGGPTLLPGDRAPAPLEDPDGAWRAAQSQAPGLMGQLLTTPPELLDVGWVNGPSGRALVAPAVTGYGSAADLALLWDWWASPAAEAALGHDLWAASLAVQAAGHDHVLDRPVGWGLGPQVDEAEVGMGGVGGCAGWIHRPTDLAIGLTTCQVGPYERLDPIDEALARL